MPAAGAHRVDAVRHDHHAAPDVHLVGRTGRLDGICVVGERYGQILVANGQREEGLAVLRRSEAGYRKLRRDSDAEQVAGLIRQIEAGPAGAAPASGPGEAPRSGGGLLARARSLFGL